MKPHDFHLRVAEALSGCQLVEQELKLYISEALELVVKLLDGRLPFSMSGRDFEDASLERLIETFRKLSDNAALVADLRKFKAERNFLSHRAIAECVDRTGELDNQEVAAVDPRLLAIARKARDLRLSINEEAYKFRVHLWPDLGAG